MEAWQRPGGYSGDDVCHTVRPRQCDLLMEKRGGRWMGCQPVPRHCTAQSTQRGAHMNVAAAANILAPLEPIFCPVGAQGGFNGPGYDSNGKKL